MFMAKIAVVGTGIAGLGASYLLHPHHDIVVYEKANRVGGHSRTLTIDYDGARIPVDTGFIVFNEPNYPHLSAMFRHLGVRTHESDMTFAATIRDGWLEWGAKNFDTAIGQRRNLLRPRFGKLVHDVLKFNASALDTVERKPDLTLDELIDELRLGDWFRNYYLLPMTGAIWSCPPREMLAFPARALVRFFANHHLLNSSGQPQWYTVTGGSEQYVSRLSRSFASKVRMNCGVRSVRRENGFAIVTDASGHSDRFDDVILACHADESLALLADANDVERSALGAFRYQQNRAVLHRDPRFMPKRKRCWASWVYTSDGRGDDPAIFVTYWMNLLQGIRRDRPLFVTLNPALEIPERAIFDAHEFAHPVFDHAAMAAQKKLQALQGTRNLWFCGAHMRHGFHEDGLASAVHVAELLGGSVPWTTAKPVAAFSETKPPLQRTRDHQLHRLADSIAAA
jgi:predicted NAD/FAD-binding protein